MTTASSRPDAASNLAECSSALVDGHLLGDAAARTLEWLCSTPEGRRQWQLAHLVGDVLRHGQASDPSRDADFLQALQRRLRHEAPSALPSMAPVSIADDHETASGAVLAHPEAMAANDAVFRWRMVAGLATLALAAVLGWSWREPAGNLLAGWATPTPTSPGAAAPVLAGAGTEPAGPARMLRDPQLDALLAAHKQVGGASALQLPAGFLRNATFEGAGR